ncbi:MAG: transposase InsO family protein [Hyphomonas sp.]|jgi:transposase InsO family protein
MNLDKNAGLTPIRREELAKDVVSGRLTPSAAAKAYGVCRKTVLRWVARFRRLGPGGMTDKSSRPDRLHQPTDPETVARILALRREGLTGKHVARLTGVSPATVSRVQKRAGLSRLRDLDPPEPVRRYEHNAPGDMIHLDIKKLGRFERPGHRVTGDRTGQSTPRGPGKKGHGWEYVHVCVDDHSRLAYAEIVANEQAISAVAHLKASVAWYKTLRVSVTRVMTDNGSCYISRDFASACRQLGLRHIRTKPYTPKTNGKAERFIQTAIREWAYARTYQTSDHRADHLKG